MKTDRFYYYDEENDLTEYVEGREDTYAVWVNPHLTLLFSLENSEKPVGFQLNGMKHILHKAEEQASTPLTPKQEKQIEEIFIEAG